MAWSSDARVCRCGFDAREAPADAQACPQCERVWPEGLLLRASNAAQEAVDHPAHYGGRDSTYEAIKVIDAWKLDFALGNAVKYIARAGKKDPTKEIEDLRKARWYLDHRITQLEKARKS